MASFAFEDDPNIKKDRPVIVLENNGVFPILTAKITKHPPRDGYWGEYQIVKWAEAGLSNPSTIRLSKRLKLIESDFRIKKGILQPIDILAIQALIKENS